MKEKEKARPVISLMKARGATKEEMDQMNLYFDKYNLDETYVRVYKAIQRIKRMKGEKG